MKFEPGKITANPFEEGGPTKKTPSCEDIENTMNFDALLAKFKEGEKKDNKPE